MTIEEFVHLLKLFSSYWQYQGHPRPNAPHALLTNGLHSNGFIDTMQVLKETNLCDILALETVKRLRDHHSVGLTTVDWVIGPAMAAIDFTHDLARWLHARHGVTEKDVNGKPTVWKRHVIEPDERVLIATELMTTANGSVQQCKSGVAARNPTPPTFIDVVPVLVYRCPSQSIADGTPTLPVFRFDITNFDPNNCPYCVAGSEAIRPKQSRENWARLTTT